MVDKELQLKITTSAELSALKRTEAELVAQVARMKAYGAETAKVVALEKELAAVRARMGGGRGGLIKTGMLGEFTEFAGRIPGVSGLVGVLGGSMTALAAAGAAVAGGIAIATKGLLEYADAQQRVVAVNTVLAQSGQLLPGVSEQVQELAGKLQELYGKADDEWMDVFKRLLQFGAKPEQLEQYSEAVANLAGILGGDINTAAMLFSRAMQGNFEMFGRYGIRVEEAGTKTERLEKLMRQLAQRGGGVLENQSKTLSGQLQRLKNNLSDIFEAVGKFIDEKSIYAKLSDQGSALEALTYATRWWADAMSDTYPVQDGLVNKLSMTTQTTEELEKSMESYTKTLQKQAGVAAYAADQTSRQKDQLRELARQQDELSDLDMAQELANIDADPNASDDQKNRQRVAVRKKYDKQKFENSQKLIDDQIAANKGFQTEAEGRSAARTQAEKEQEEKAKQSAAFAEEEAKAVKIYNDKQATIEKLKLERTKRRNRRRSVGLAERLPVDGLEYDTAGIDRDLRLNAQQRDAAKAEVDRIRAEREKIGLGTPGEEAERLKALKKANKEEEDVDTKAYTQAGQEIESLQQRKDFEAKKRGKQETIEKTTEKTESGKSNQAVAARAKEIQKQAIQDSNPMLDDWEEALRAAFKEFGYNQLEQINARMSVVIREAGAEAERKTNERLKTMR